LVVDPEPKCGESTSGLIAAITLRRAKTTILELNGARQIAMAERSSDVIREAETKYRLSTRGAVNFTGDNFWAPIEQALDNPWTPENPNGT
jgi:hypothetical protein